jgi:hypothetical protein
MLPVLVTHRARIRLICTILVVEFLFLIAMQIRSFGRDLFRSPSSAKMSEFQA